MHSLPFNRSFSASFFFSKDSAKADTRYVLDEGGLLASESWKIDVETEEGPDS